MWLENVKVVNHNETIENANIEIQKGKIVGIHPTEGIATKIVVPGFVDEHIHGFNGYDVMDGKEALENISVALAKRGTTTFLPTWITNSEEVMTKALENINGFRPSGAKVFGYHMEGPFVSVERKGAHDENYITKANIGFIDALVKASDNSIRKITIAPENFPIDLVKYLIEKNIIPSIGHTNVSAKEARKYIDAGVKSATHLWNAMSGVSNRQAGVVEETLLNENIYAEVIFDLIHVDKDALELTIKSKGVNGLVAVTDAIKPAGLEDGDSVSGGLEVTKVGNKITLKGKETIAGSGATMHDNFKNIVNVLNLSIEDAVKLTSYNPSRNLGLLKMGQIKEGYEADIVVLNKELNIDHTIIGGEIWK